MHGADAIAECKIGMVDGRLVNLSDPAPGDMRIEDIARALSHQCRWGGHVRRFFSVAEHCCLVSDVVLALHERADLAYSGLMHDASEAYLVDVPAPIKSVLPTYIDIEDRLMRRLAERFAFEWPVSREVFEVDQKIRGDEENALREGKRPQGAFRGYDVAIRCWAPAHAREQFMRRWRDLSDDAKRAA